MEQKILIMERNQLNLSLAGKVRGKEFNDSYELICFADEIGARILKTDLFITLLNANSQNLQNKCFSYVTILN